MYLDRVFLWCFFRFGKPPPSPPSFEKGKNQEIGKSGNRRNILPPLSKEAGLIILLSPFFRTTHTDERAAHETGTGEGGPGDGSGEAARKKSRKAEAAGRGEGDEDDSGDDEDGDEEEESDLSSEHLSASMGSMGSDLEEHEDDPFAAMEKDLEAQKDEEEKRMG